MNDDEPVAPTGHVKCPAMTVTRFCSNLPKLAIQMFHMRLTQNKTCMLQLASWMRNKRVQLFSIHRLSFPQLR